MSLINKMLQDLDARGGASGGAAPVNLRPVAASAARWRAPALAAGAGAAALVLAAGGYFGWRAVQATAPAAPAAGPKMVQIRQPAAAAPAPAPAPATVAAAVAPAPATPEPSAIIPESKAEARERRAAAHAAAKQAQEENAPLKSKDAAVPKAREAKAARATQAGAGASGDLSSQQRAENDYRRALAALQEGRLAETMAGLEQAVYTDPRHEAARQTLVGLLLESKRNDEAMRHLQMGLGLDPKQLALAMILARLQIEKGGPAIDTLLRTLPHAAGNAEYLGFLAGALQRAQRHGEAVEHYQAALRLSPQSGVWWMGLGISQQAEKRNAAAREAYERAKDVGNLTPELQNFVERKLQQLAR